MLDIGADNRPTPNSLTHSHTHSSTRRPIGSSTRRPIGSSTRRPIGSSTRRPIGSSTRRPIGSSTRRPIGSSTRRPIGSSTRRPIGSSTRRPIGSSTRLSIIIISLMISQILLFWHTSSKFWSVFSCEEAHLYCTEWRETSSHASIYSGTETRYSFLNTWTELIWTMTLLSSLEQRYS